MTKTITQVTDVSQLKYRDFPIYFHDTANDKGVRFASKTSPGYRYRLGKREPAPTGLSLSFWVTSENFPRVDFQTFKKIGYKLLG